MMTLLDNSMFDDGSIEAKTFCIVGKSNGIGTWDLCLGEDTCLADFSYIEAHYKEYIESIKLAIHEGKSYIGIDIEGTYTEFQWD